MRNTAGFENFKLSDVRAALDETFVEPFSPINYFEIYGEFLRRC